MPKPFEIAGEVPAEAPAATGVSSQLHINALVVLGSVFLVSVLGNGAFHMHFGLGTTAFVLAAVFLLLIFFVAFRGLAYHGYRHFGLANTITAIRAAIISAIASIIFFAERTDADVPFVWGFICLTIIALALDGVDGFLARSFAEESDFGARFDMEIDALLILILSIAALVFGKAGAWVLLIGLMRYGFVIAQYFKPRLSEPLPASFRRKLICVVQIGALCLLLLPAVTPPLSSIIALFALLLLSYSFAVDVLYLLRSDAGEV